MVLLDAGIDVLPTMNLQHLESLNDQIQHITSVRVRETVPDWVIKQADEIVMVDVTPEALINRLKRGVVYDTDKATRALENFFREQSLAALRELALRQAAHEVEVRHESPQAVSRQSADRLLLHITREPATALLVRRGRRVADYLRADCFAVYISETDDLNNLPPEEREVVDRHLNFARNLHIETRVLQGHKVPAVLVDFARRERITQIFVVRPERKKWKPLRLGDTTSGILRLAHDMQVTIVAERMKAPM
jgi:two-component system sensor histidine kinase KdpD